MLVKSGTVRNCRPRLELGGNRESVKSGLMLADIPNTAIRTLGVLVVLAVLYFVVIRKKR
jgi:hypothetical protein